MLTKKGRKIMLTKSKIAVIVAVSGMVSASPTFAQSFNSPEGSGNSLPMHYDSRGGKHCDRLAACTGIAPQQVQIATDRGGLNAFASIGHSGFASDEPSNTGGGIASSQWR
jgi:hypothetical protein